METQKNTSGNSGEKALRKGLSIREKTVFPVLVGVDAAATEIRSGGEQIKTSFAELSVLAEQLKTLVGRFRILASLRGSGYTESI